MIQMESILPKLPNFLSNQPLSLPLKFNYVTFYFFIFILIFIRWPDEPIKALGTYFTYDLKLFEEKNFIEHLDSVKKMIHICLD